MLLVGSLTSSPALAEEPDVVIISVDSTNLRFSPSEVTIQEGDTVRFFWSGQLLPHNAVARDGTFDSGEPERAVDYPVLFEVGSNGTYEFVCEPHEAAGMVGTITVEPAPPVNGTTGEQDIGGLEAQSERMGPASTVLLLLILGLIPLVGWFMRGDLPFLEESNREAE